MGVWANGARPFVPHGAYVTNPYIFNLKWFRQHGYLFDGKYADLESFIRGRWEAGFLTWDANDMLTLFDTWSTADISLVRDGGDFEKALKSIKVKGLIMPSKTDLYFPVSIRYTLGYALV